ncbi:MAG: hypothetical protein LC722_05500 [Actinobacteria bacterium]|nr:hypothetical protein [Actinomycetota bacterium]
MSELRKRLDQALAGFEPKDDVGAAIRRARRHQRNHRITAGALAMVVTVAGVAVAARQFSRTERPNDIAGAPDGLLVFASDRDSARNGVRDLYSIRPDGTGLRRLTATPDDDEAYPAVSPDGRTIAYVVVGGDLGFIRFIGIDGSQVEAPSGVSSLSDHSGVAWSPDGQSLAYVPAGITSCPRMTPGEQSDCRPPSGVWIARLNHGDKFEIPRPLCATGCGGDHDPAWSPDGSTIAFTRTGFGFNSFDHLILASPDGGGLRGTGPNAFPGARAPAWSPDGLEIAAESGGRIIAIDVATRESRNVWVGSGMVSDPAWSPDGSRIAFLTAQGGIRITSAHDPTVNKIARIVADIGPTVTDLTWSTSVDSVPTPAPTGSTLPATPIALDADPTKPFTHWSEVLRVPFGPGQAQLGLDKDGPTGAGAIAVTASGDVWVLDNAKRRVVLFARDGGVKVEVQLPPPPRGIGDLALIGSDLFVMVDGRASLERIRLGEPVETIDVTLEGRPAPLGQLHPIGNRLLASLADVSGDLVVEVDPRTGKASRLPGLPGRGAVFSRPPVWECNGFCVQAVRATGTRRVILEADGASNVLQSGGHPVDILDGNLATYLFGPPGHLWFLSLTPHLEVAAWEHLPGPTTPELRGASWARFTLGADGHVYLMHLAQDGLHVLER